MVAGMEECSNSEFGAGPLGLLTTGTQIPQVFFKTRHKYHNCSVLQMKNDIKGKRGAKLHQ